MKRLFKFNLFLSAIVALMLLSSFAEEDSYPPGLLPNTPAPLFESVFVHHSYACNWFWHGTNGVWYLYMCPEELCWDIYWETCNYPYVSHSRYFPPSRHVPWYPY